MGDPTNATSSNEDLNMNPRTNDNDAPDDPNYVTFKIVNQDGEEFYFSTRRVVKFGKVFESYCQRNELERGTTRFFFNGCRVLNHIAPIDINFKTGDVIEAFSYVHGGGSFK